MTKRMILIGYGLRDAADRTLTDLPRELREAFRRVDPEAELVYAPLPLDLDMQARMRAGSREELLQYTDRFPPEYLRTLPEAAVLFTLFAPVDVLERAPKLRWIANAGSGTEQYQAHGILGSRVMLSSSKGVAARSVAEFAMSQLLLLARCWPARIADQREHRWRWHTGRDLHTMTLGIVGLGEIGCEAARMAKAFGMRVVGTRRKADKVPPNVDRVFPADALHAMLAEADAVLIAAAYSSETMRFFDRAAFAAMRPGSFLLNVARGGLVDEEVLADALRSGHLRGAAFDVFAQEPLPADSPLWDVPNLVISAHNAVGMADYSSAAFRRFLDDYARFLRGEPVRGRVDPLTGY
ncbi:MAG TPA: D-2-hydroxyacid dehydrogenase [Ramlibacter sp.]|nr:D-2-hydroxyacid dehydrogenase [Ramlibacter sp.]